MENKIVTSELGKALFKYKHDMPMNPQEKQLIKKSSSAMMAATMYENNKIKAKAKSQQDNAPEQFILSQQAAASEDVSVEEIFVSSPETLERIFSLQIEQDEDDGLYYILWYFVDHSDYIKQLLVQQPRENGTPIISLYFVTDKGLPSELRERVSSIAITGETLTPESLYEYHIPPKEALKHGDFSLAVDYD